MSERHVLIVGGGLAGLSAGCYLRASGFRTTIVEHHSSLGGVCASWTRGPYTIDGCLQWLTGGAFDVLYRELGLLPRLQLRTLNEFATYRDVRSGVEVVVGRDLDEIARQLRAISPADAAEIDSVVAGARKLVGLKPPIEQAPELTTFRQQIKKLWSMRHELPTIEQFRVPLGKWTAQWLESEALRRFFLRLMPADAPVLFLQMMLGYLEQGWLSRPDGGARALLEALIDTYRSLDGRSLLRQTVDEILVDDGHASGVRLADGTILEADLVISTASMPETVLRLLGGRYGARETRARLDRWTLVAPIVLASFGVASPLADTPSSQIIDGVEPFDVGGRQNDHLRVRIYNDEPSFAPVGHTVVQVSLETQYAWWATRRDRYQLEKDAVAEQVLQRLDAHVPGVHAAVQMRDVATPLTFWNAARSWRGAYEGWLPSPDAVFQHLDKTLSGLNGFYMAGQWLEPGGGIPMALMSGRQVAEIVCADEEIELVHQPARVELAPPARV
jgi:phytoene dehydrogenase-like protein